MGKNGETGLLLGGLALVFLMAGSKKTGSPMPNPLPSALPSGSKLPFDGKLTTFVRLALPYAIQANKQFPKVPPTLILMQSGLETGYGKHAPGNMFFGVKAGKNYTGEKQLLRTTEIFATNTGHTFPEVIKIEKITTGKNAGKYRWIVRDWFRKYPTPLGSFLDYCKLLSHSRYAKALAVSPDVNKMIVEIKAAGYATDPDYVAKNQKLAALIQPLVAKYA